MFYQNVEKAGLNPKNGSLLEKTTPFLKNVSLWLTICMRIFPWLQRTLIGPCGTTHVYKRLKDQVLILFNIRANCCRYYWQKMKVVSQLGWLRMFHECFSWGGILHIRFFKTVQIQSVTIYTIKFNNYEICVMVPVWNIFLIAGFIYDGPPGSCHQNNTVPFYTFPRFLFYLIDCLIIL